CAREGGATAIPLDVW
nr:immunoglobulin heavy chain junction region [Macaca mulatta]MOW86880.1 immunoglobulin heavy chain junction region [Macaca mulatta]MOW87415.1 immunoglobulin heavy chain junction region [Macaca mulatta]MOW87429.1 immunoglobulin heavy chain junction region [Macaca mulatta]MOW87643.1 immunoglobulin heavy chain junction region [Macaca mulatta]